MVVDLRTGDAVHSLRIEGVVEELYDVAVLPGARRPAALELRTDEVRPPHAEPGPARPALAGGAGGGCARACPAHAGRCFGRPVARGRVPSARIAASAGPALDEAGADQGGGEQVERLGDVGPAPIADGEPGSGRTTPACAPRPSGAGPAARSRRPRAGRSARRRRARGRHGGGDGRSSCRRAACPGAGVAGRRTAGPAAPRRAADPAPFVGPGNRRIRSFRTTPAGWQRQPDPAVVR
jgi:Domain of unknown function (DUF4915)